MTSIYENMLIERLSKIGNFNYKDIKSLDKYPSCVSEKALRILIENACQGQNCAPIEVARKKVNEINKDWLKENMLEVANSCLDFSDEWEYRRFMELVELTVPELKQKVLEIGEKSEIDDIREVAQDFKNGQSKI